ncbi:pyridoxamine 5'-phosphate oxidase family protein [Leptotrichia sp. OH3620_COT-345]|uniref:pyridoxamine 5'-phosphate oxidase family protein n=1 Tax=Leptotrichia sp. OH3620_COT-345 TaxID=2491048 RepID=UPI000F6554E7|nr:pyridoxamine 5'-phosphate oxidase family protein [Leptotrichia sp. OH3620_COT-345]RRD38901.1 pyridoxamine 5'-phosphate oxidase family protein [Leptotrichia sp. OH3620_COT-345]
MDRLQEEFKNIMKEQTEIALATSVNNIPNVRITCFYYDEETKILFMSSLKNHKKIGEFSNNDNVAFTTIPKTSSKYVRGKGKIKKSDKSVYDLKDKFINKIPYLEYIIEKVGDSLILFEIPLSEITLTLENQDIHKISIL